MFRTFFVLVATLAALAIPADAEARKRLVVLDVTGPGGDRIGEQLDLLLARRHATVSASRFSQSAREIGATARSNGDIVKVASELALDGIVLGEVSEREENYRLTIRLREGRSGKVVQTIAVRLESPELTRGAARQVWRLLMPAIDDLRAVGIVDIDEESESTPPPPDDLDVGSPPSQSDPKEAPDEERADAGAAGTPSAPSSEGAAQAPAPDAAPAEPTARAAPGSTGASSGADPSAFSPLTLRIGPSISRRALTFAYDESLENEPGRYIGQTSPGAYLSAELYPLAFSRDDALARIGITAMLDHVLLIESHYEGVSLPTSQSKASAGLVYRHDFGAGRNDLSIKGSLRLSTLSFEIDREPAPSDIDVPNVAYRYVDPGLRARYPIGDFALYGEARTMLMLATGEIQRIDQYGTATTLGVDLELGVEYAFATDLSARGGFRYTGISHEFSGDGARTDRGGSNDVDVAGAHDSYMGGYLTLGYHF